MFLLNGQPLQLDIPFEVNGTSYPANWLRLTSIEEKNAIGITEVTDTQVTYDGRFYWGVNNPKQLEDITVTPEQGDPYTQYGLKTLFSSQIKETAKSLLTQTDWMVTRKVERDIDIPADTVTYRAAVLAECTRLVNDIINCTDVDGLQMIVTTQKWPRET
jgi:hypothetical protein